MQIHPAHSVCGLPIHGFSQPQMENTSDGEKKDGYICTEQVQTFFPLHHSLDNMI